MASEYSVHPLCYVLQYEWKVSMEILNGIMFAIMDDVINGIVVMELKVFQVGCGILSCLLLGVLRVIQEMQNNS